MSSLKNETTVSFVITSHNQEDLIVNCLNSLPWGSKFEWDAVVVDDKSTDATVEVIEAFLDESSSRKERINLVVLDSNSGGPSIPRNRGIAEVDGEYIFFIDGDDYLLSEGFDEIVSYLLDQNLDVLRLPMAISIDSEIPRVVDRVKLRRPASFVDVTKACVTQQSMGVMAFSRRSVIVRNGIQFDPSVKMGEDLVFMSQVISAAESIDYFDTALYVYRKFSEEGTSATTSYSPEMFGQAVASWNKVQEHYLEKEVDFLQCHGVGSISYGMGQLQKYYVRLDEGTFTYFSEFVNRWKDSIPFDNFQPYYQEMLSAAVSKDFDRFREAEKPRLLIAGSDLKFIKPAISGLSENFQIRVDEWPSEAQFDEARSLELLNWAQLVWVEWMTFASEWYSKNVRAHHKLVVRCHFYELTRDSGFRLDRKNVGAFVAIALHTYEDLIEKFRFDRNRVHLVPNFYDVEAYNVNPNAHDPFSLALIGSVPRRKGLHRAMEILRSLKEIDSRYSLTIFGKRPTDFGWVNGVKQERDYYAACDRFAERHGLEDSIKYSGWADIRKELANFGFVLSTSDFEGSHVAPGEAFCAQVPVAVLNWRGAEYVYPKDVIFSSTEEIVDYIVESRKSGVWKEYAQKGKSFFKRHQDLPVFIEDVMKLYQESKTVAELRK